MDRKYYRIVHSLYSNVIFVRILELFHQLQPTFSYTSVCVVLFFRINKLALQNAQIFCKVTFLFVVYNPTT